MFNFEFFGCALWEGMYIDTQIKTKQKHTEREIKQTPGQCHLNHWKTQIWLLNPMASSESQTGLVLNVKLFYE